MDAAHRHRHEAGACPHAAEQQARAGDAIERAEAACQAKGVRLTPLRRQVLEALYASHRPAGAYDIADALRGDRRVAPITIYRALDFLIEQGFVHRLATRNAFVACPHSHQPQDPVAFLICEGCGGVDEVSSRDLSGALAGLLDRENFAADRPVIEIAGRCAHCRTPGRLS